MGPLTFAGKKETCVFKFSSNLAVVYL